MQQPFGLLDVTDPISIVRRMFKKSLQQGRSERRDEADSFPNVESLSDGRTKLDGFFNILPVLILTVSVGCATSQGFDRAAMHEVLPVAPPPIPDSQPLTNQNPRRSPPFRLAIFFADHDFPTRPSIRRVEWLSADKDQLLRELTPLRDEQLLMDTFVLMDATLRAEDTLGIRQAAARHEADMVLIVTGAAAVDRYNNLFAWLYPTIIGAYLAPGTESDALVIATGSLWAVHSDWHPATQTVEGQSKVKGPAVFVQDAVALHEAKQQAIHALGKGIAEQLQHFK